MKGKNIKSETKKKSNVNTDKDEQSSGGIGGFAAKRRTKKEPKLQILDKDLLLTETQLRTLIKQNKIQIENLRASNEKLLAKNSELKTENSELSHKIGETLHQSEEKYRKLFDSINQGFCVIEMIFDENNEPVDYVFIEVNEVFKKLSGLNSVIGKRVKELIPDVEHKWIENNGRVALTGESIRFENFSLKTNRWYEIYLSRFGVEANRRVVILFTDITERKLAVEALRESEEKYRNLFNSIDSGFCVIEMVFDENKKPLDYKFLEINPVFETQTGLKNALGKTALELVPNLEYKWLEIYGNVALTGKSIRFENNSVPMNRWFEVYASRVGDDSSNKIALVFTDITERKLSEKAMQESEERFRTAVESAPNAMLLVDGNGKISLINSQTEKLFGYDRNELLDETVEILLPDRFLKDHTKLRAGFMSNSSARQMGTGRELFALRKNGEEVPVEIGLNPLKISGENFVLISIIDITERKIAEEERVKYQIHLEEKVQERTLELAQANKKLKLENSQRRKAEKEIVSLLNKIVTTQEDERRRIARDIHDHFGQQLTAMRLKLASLRSSCAGNSKLLEYVEQTKAIARQLDSDMSFLVWELRPTALDDFGLRDAIIDFTRKWSDHFKIPSEIHIGTFEERLLNDNTQINLYRILQETLNNTYKYAQASQVNVILERRENNMIMIIEDNGIGFEPGKTVNRRKGLGLIGMRERAALIGGELEIESAPGKGTAIFVRIPITLNEGEES